MKDYKEIYNSMANYDDIYNLMARYAREKLDQFSDGWNRFPVGENAHEIAEYLKTRSIFYSELDHDVSEKLEAAASEILKRNKL